jgi:chemotaxis protein methyltransferase CheR
LQEIRNSSAFAGGELGDDDFAAIREVLRERRRFDLGSYKDNCIRRRIARRIRSLGIDGARAYLELLRGDAGEIDFLLAALTIHVSQFFRNPDTFAALEKKVLPEILRRHRGDGRHVRLWSVGCASGEEPYSLALLLAEMAPDVPVSILGTDLSPNILEKARAGIYDPLRLTKVPPAVQSRYFTPEGNGFRLRDDIRSRVKFQRQDILAENTFPAADLILCRNVLIYFSREQQEEILLRFAAVLREGGWLVLGKAETLLGEARALFTSEYPAERIYCRKQSAGAT